MINKGVLFIILYTKDSNFSVSEIKFQLNCEEIVYIV